MPGSFNRLSATAAAVALGLAAAAAAAASGAGRLSAEELARREAAAAELEHLKRIREAYTAVVDETLAALQVELDAAEGLPEAERDEARLVAHQRARDLLQRAGQAARAHAGMPAS